MKKLLPLITFGALLAGCANVTRDVAPPINEALSPAAIFQADTAQTPAQVAQCVYQLYQGRDGIGIEYQSGGGRAVVASSGGAVSLTVETIQFTPTASGTHVEIHQLASAGRDPLGFIKSARVCGAMSGS